MKKAILVFICLVCLAEYSESAVTKRPAYVKDKPGGKIILQLLTGAFVRDVKEEGNHLEIEIDASARKSEFPRMRQEDIPVFTANGKKLGMTRKAELKSWNEDEQNFLLLIDGYVNKEDFVENSLHDRRMNVLLRNDQPVSEKDFLKLFQDWKNSDPDLVETWNGKDLGKDPYLMQGIPAAELAKVGKRNFRLIGIFNYDPADPSPKSMAGFLDGRLRFVGLHPGTYARKPVLKTGREEYFAIGAENVLPEEKVYLDMLVKLFEYRP